MTEKRQQLEFSVDMNSAVFGFTVGIYGMYQLLSYSQITILTLGIIIGYSGCYWKDDIQSWYDRLVFMKVVEPIEPLGHFNEPIPILEIENADIAIDEKEDKNGHSSFEPNRYADIKKYSGFIRVFEKNQDSFKNIRLETVYIGEKCITKTKIRHILKELFREIHNIHSSNDFKEIMVHKVLNTVILGSCDLKTAKYLVDFDISIRNNEPSIKYIIDILKLAVLFRMNISMEVSGFDKEDSFNYTI